jgi:hypothetical protein
VFKRQPSDYKFVTTTIVGGIKKQSINTHTLLTLTVARCHPEYTKEILDVGLLLFGVPEPV